MFYNFILFYFPIKNVLSDLQNLELLSSEVEETLVGLEIYLLRSSQGHSLICLSMMEGCVSVLIVVIGLFPENSKERAVSPLALYHPEVLMDFA
jgi:hypothetical protein